jgi:outer membrane protein assembly factor BamB
MGMMRQTVLLLASMAVAVLLASGVASAALSNLADEGTVNVDGQVRTILEVGNRIYIGGDFTHVNGISRNYLAAMDATTGQLTGWNPNPNANVRALAVSPDGTRIYVGGAFTAINGISRGHLAALDPATGAVMAWRPAPSSGGSVRAIALSGNRLYIGGDFTTVNGQSRSRLALIDATTGELDPNWVPTANESVRTLVLSADGSRLYAGGNFTSVSGNSRPYLAAIRAATGALDTTFQPPNPNGLVFALVASGGRVYTAEGGGGGQAAAYDASTGTRAWRYSADGDVQGISVLAGEVYLAGHFETFAGRARRVFAAVDASTGAVDPNWTPTADPAFPGVWVLSTSRLFPRIYAGGDFSRISGEPHLRFGQFTESSGTPVDTTAPETTITSGPSGTVSSRDATFGFSSTESGSRFECSLDGAAYLACSSPQIYTALANGSHTFQVRATDGAGNTDPTAASRTWKVRVSGKA